MSGQNILCEILEAERQIAVFHVTENGESAHFSVAESLEQQSICETTYPTKTRAQNL